MVPVVEGSNPSTHPKIIPNKSVTPRYNPLHAHLLARPLPPHLNSCTHADKGRDSSLCHCPIWVYGRLNGESYRRSIQTTAAPATSPPGSTPAPAPSPISSTSLALAHLIALTVELLTAFRDQRIAVDPDTGKPRTFCAWCVDREYLRTNAAKKLKPPKIEGIATKPLDPEEIDKLIAACDRMRGMWQEDNPLVRQRARALVLLLLLFRPPLWRLRPPQTQQAPPPRPPRTPHREKRRRRQSATAPRCRSHPAGTARTVWQPAYSFWSGNVAHVHAHSEMPRKRTSPNAKSGHVFGQARKPAKMFRAACTPVFPRITSRPWRCRTGRGASMPPDAVELPLFSL